MEEKLKELREKAIKLALAIIKVSPHRYRPFTESDIDYVSIESNSSLCIYFIENNYWDTDEHRDYIQLSIKEIMHDDFDMVVEKYRLLDIELKKQSDMAKELEEKKIKRTSKDLKLYKKLKEELVE